MANRKIEMVEIDTTEIKRELKKHKISIRNLAKCLDRDERTLRKYFKIEEMPVEIKKRLDQFILALGIHSYSNDYTMEELFMLKQQYLTAKYAYLNYKRKMEELNKIKEGSDHESK